LFAASGGYCQNPGCSRHLFVDAAGQSIHVGEMAHVFAASESGPRANPAMSKAERGSFENLILLCANCHTMVDKAAEAFPDAMMLDWKRDHYKRLQAVFGVTIFVDRAAARVVIAALLNENRAIFERYGPHIEAARDPESGAAEIWQRKMLTRILPNSNRMLAQLDANKALLTDIELRVLEDFRQHIDDLETVHITGERYDAAQFPVEMQTILEGC
jgi:hypothetical protein|tara:strand:+ start:2638 stop:3285 length:648 start_codon:yes stop_codon:yes gene_type:complete